ncbi:MAG: efflux RND transporter permease subunit [Candidatus Hinthialibacter antarcticus]|nr:efflux RND transporter permease subunit [Candidatus Hinthialibacter antarcticus]
MMKWLITTALEMRVLVLALAVVLIIVGIRTAKDTRLDVFPEFAPPRVEIQTEAPGLSVEEVDSLVTLPLENALNGTPLVTKLRSKSVLGLSSITLFFEKGTNLNTAHHLVQERLTAELERLPAVARAPVILPPLSSTSRVMKIGMSSDTLSQMDMTELAKWTIRPRLMALPGVANIAIWGQRDRQYQIIVEPEQLRLHNIPLDSVITAAQDITTLGAGGFLDTPNQRLAIFHDSPIKNTEDLANSLIKFQDGAPIRLGDVAKVEIGFPPPIGDAIINDGPGLLLIVEMYPWGNTLNVTRQVEAVLETLRPGLGDVLVDSTIFRPATFIETALTNLSHALLIGCVLVVIVLVAFLFNWRAALISALAIPLSLIAAMLVIHHQGETINTMVIAGLVIALGSVVDDAIIDVENIARRLRLNAKAGNPDSSFWVVLKASLEVRSAIVYASLIVILVFLPVFFLEGLAGAFFKPLAFSYVLAILASLIVALTVTPALSLMLLPQVKHENEDPPLTSVLKRIYRSVLPMTVSRPSLVVVFLVIAMIGAAIAVPNLGEEFFPKFQERDFLMHWVEKPGTSLDAMNRLTIRVSKELRAIPGVRNFGSHIGRAEVADEVVGPNFTELWISIAPEADYKTTLAKVEEVVYGYPGLYRDVLTYLSERIKEVLTGASASIVVRIYGPDLAELRETAEGVAGVISDVNGIRDLKVEQQVLVPQIKVKLRPEMAKRFNLSPGDIRRSVTTLVHGHKVGELYEGQKIVEVVVRGSERIRNDLSSLRNLLIETPQGAYIPLKDLADVYIGDMPNLIKREGASRYIDVTCNVEGRDLGSVARDVEQQVKGYNFPLEYHPEFLGEFAARQESKQRLFALTALAIMGILVLLYTDFQSIRLVCLIFLTLPFALIGGVMGAFAGGGVLSLGSLVGFVTVLGIAARNGIMLISHYRYLEDEEKMPFGVPLVIRGAEERLAPILMTALTTALALLPIVIGGLQPGYEIEYPMALVIVWGLITSTVLNLFFMPALYAKFGCRTQKESA